jgi:sigma-E factor negative regulatory protein RseA
MDTHKKIREHISTLSDGELSPADLELAFAALQSADGQQAWNTYHRIGDVLRGQATPELSDGFADKLAARLAAEPAPVRRAGRLATGDKRRGGGHDNQGGPAGPGREAQAAADPAEKAEGLPVTLSKPPVVSVS